MESARHDRRKVGILMQVLRKYQRYHAWRRYARQVNWEVQLKDQSKIDGAYLLLRRFKNRLKALDEALVGVSNNKANRQEFVELKKSI